MAALGGVDDHRVHQDLFLKDVNVLNNVDPEPAVGADRGSPHRDQSAAPGLPIPRVDVFPQPQHLVLDVDAVRAAKDVEAILDPDDQVPPLDVSEPEVEDSGLFPVKDVAFAALVEVVAISTTATSFLSRSSV